MNWLADESVNGAIVRRLRDDGHDVESIAEISPSIGDDEVLERAALSGRLLITADTDFGELVFRQGLAHAGVVLLRLAGMTSADRAEIVHNLIVAHGAELPGRFCVVTPSAVRIRDANR